MRKVSKETKIKSLKEVLKMAPKEALSYLDEHSSQVEKQYSTLETNAAYVHALSFIYDNVPEQKKVVESRRRQAWLANHQIIIHKICKGIKENGFMPSVVEISSETKLSRVTVTKHLKHFETDEYLKFHLQKWKLVTEKVLLKMSQYIFSDYVNAKDSLKAAAIYLKFADKVLQPVKASPPTNNYIQINNIYINQETIKALPEDKRHTIETLILEANEVNQPY